MTGKQIQVLQLLADGALLDRAALYDRLGFTQHSGLNDILGRMDPDKRAKNDQRYPSLLTLGYVIIKRLDIDGVWENCYEITPSGKKALEVILSQELTAMALEPG